jgi:hypothetical protein
LPEFDVAFIDESLAIAARLREQSAMKISHETRERQKELLTIRNRMITLLNERVTSARRAARFVFRHYPDVAHLAGSTYERRKRARARAAAAAEQSRKEVNAA